MHEALSKLRNDFFLEANDFEDQLKVFHKEECRQAKRKGSRDGRRNTSDSTKGDTTPTEKALFHGYNSQMAELCIDLEGYLTQIKGEYISSLKGTMDLMTQEGLDAGLVNLDECRKQELTEAEDNYHQDLESLKQDPDLVAIQHEYDSAQDAYEEVCDELDRTTPNSHWSPPVWVYVMILIGLGLGEIAATYSAFLHFEEPPITTWIWAICFGLSLSLAAHFTGIVFAIGREKKMYNRVGGGIVAAVILATIFVSRVRASSVDDLQIQHMSLPVFISIGIFIYLIGSITSWLTHDSNAGFLKLIRNRDRLKRELDNVNKKLFEDTKALKSALNKENTKINQDFEAKKLELQNSGPELLFQLREAESLHDEMLISLRNLETLVNHYFQVVVGLYRQEYLDSCSKNSNIDTNRLLELPMKFHKIKELTLDKTQGLWHYNSN